ncbi:MAG: serine hydrolase domain-containing protein [Imperialibacter sp.]|uniref:serine hydrolase domain-containing protein n=1 Tax=Imperialibacter sp. TaxID=2038411 RepID=UPI0032EFD424
MKKMLLTYLAAICFAYSCQQPETSSAPYEAAIAESSRMIDSLMTAEKVPGIDVAVAINGEIVWSQGFGYADLENEVPVKAGYTLFRIGSVSKPIAASAVAWLMDEGKLDLTQPVQTYVPNFPAKKYPVTVKQVGGHIAGIRHYRGNEMLSSSYYPTVAEGLDIFKDDTLLFEPGTRYSYSSYGFNLLSAVVEGASGEDFLPFVQKNVFDALHMGRTTPDVNHEIIQGRTSFYDLDSLGSIVNATYVDNSYKWAGGGFISCTTDLIKFGEAYRTGTFLSDSSRSILLTSQVLADGNPTGYGVGWGVWEKNGRKGFGHTGGSVGGITDFRVYPKEGLILVLLSNSSVTKYGNVSDRIVELFLAGDK